MIGYLSRRMRYSLIVLWGVVTVIFFLFNALPADPARLTMGQRSDIASVENARRQLNLDKPLLTRYLLYLNDLLPLSINSRDSTGRQGYHYIPLIPLTKNKALVLKWPQLGRSYYSNKAVNDILWDALPNTALLAVVAMFFATTFGILMGVLAAVK